jgi:hypothetical protein
MRVMAYRRTWRQVGHGEGKDRRHIHLAGNDFDVRAGIVSARRLHRIAEFAKRGHTRGIPVRASKRFRQFGVVPWCEVVVRPVRVLF